MDLCPATGQARHSRTSGCSPSSTSLVREVTDNLEKFELGIAVSKLYDFIWDIFCDWYIELVKVPPAGGRRRGRGIARQVLVYVMTGILQTAASLHAVHHRGDLAGAAA